MIVSKLGSRGRTSVPKPVRAALKLRKGDDLAYRIDRGGVVLTKAPTRPIADSFKTFEEWDSEVDRQGYADLSAR